ncbi:MAG: L-threonylcarbamoyladenylate synthase [Candidatus Binataceae bacterium]
MRTVSKSSSRRRGAAQVFTIGDAIDALRRARLIVYPTDTWYALGADALSRDALRRLFALKRRDPDKPVALIAADATMAFALASSIPFAARRFAEAFWPGPLTIVMPARRGIPAEIVGPDGGVGVRVPANHVARELATAIGVPLTATSANRSGNAPARTLAEARSAFGAKVEVYLEGGQLDAPAPSTVVATSEDGWRMIREGAVPETELAAALASGTLA